LSIKQCKRVLLKFAAEVKLKKYGFTAAAKSIKKKYFFDFTAWKKTEYSGWAPAAQTSRLLYFF
jgi:hypothetical protein